MRSSSLRRIPVGAIAVYVFFFAVVSASAQQGELSAAGRFSAIGALEGLDYPSGSRLFAAEPRSTAWNPAGEADRELPAFAFDAALAFPSDPKAGSGAGGFTSFSAAIPTPFAVAWFIADETFGAPDLPSWATPAGVSLLAGASKRVSDYVSLGLGFGASIADVPERTWNAAFSVGLEFDLPALTPAGSVLSLSVLGIGSGLGSESAPLTAPMPMAAFESRFLDSGPFELALSGAIAAPAFKDFAATLGASLGIGGSLFFDLGWSWSQDGFQALPSIGLRFVADEVLRIGGFGAKAAAIARPLSAESLSIGTSAIFSRGEADTEGPAVIIGIPVPANVSPRRDDSVEVPLSVHDDSPVTAFELGAYDGAGRRIFMLAGNAAEGGGEGFFARLFRVEKAVDVPSSVRIPVDPALADGAYRLRASARDARGNEGSAAEGSFVVDGTPPTASAEIVGMAVLTPDGDGNNDSLHISQSGSIEARWTGGFISAEGIRIRSFAWTDGSPESFSWDGRDDEGRFAADGKYSYLLEAEDAAGNRGEAHLANLVLDTEATPLAISIGSFVLSTDPDAASPPVVAIIKAPRLRGLQSWSIKVISDSERTVREWRGSTQGLALLPSSVAFDGRDIEGESVPDGKYFFRAQTTYSNGNAPAASSPAFVVDSKRPSGRARPDRTVMILGRDAATIYHDLSRFSTWRGFVADAGGTVVRVLPLGSSPEIAVEWNGFGDDRSPVADGEYTYVAEGRSAVGLIGRTAPFTIRVESDKAEVELVAESRIFSPNLNDGKLRLIPRLEKRERVVSWELAVSDLGGGAAVRTFTGIPPVPAAVAWDGLDDFGAPVRDGEYRAVISVLFDGGARGRSSPVPFALDGTPPRAGVRIAADLFSPNGDGRLDTIRISQDGGRESEWLGTIMDEAGNEVRTYVWKGSPAGFLEWDGRNDDKALVPDGRYRYRLSASDEAGNAGFTESPFFMLDSRRPALYIAADKSAFSPNGDGYADSIAVRVVPSFLDGLESASLLIKDASGKTVRALSRTKILAGEIGWDGRDDGGRPAASGSYRAVAELGYLKGDVVASESAFFVLDADPPRISASFSSLPFSPDGDGENDELSIALRAEDMSPLAGWQLSIMDPYGYLFTSFSGKELPSGPFGWDGMDLDGNLVEAAQDYSWEFLVRDTLGNMGKSSGIIPIDVFVLRDGDRLKIRISSITFAPSSALLETGTKETDENNMRVLDRIAATLAKFPSYRIVVEGHAANISGTEREERSELEPLSLGRARSVLEALVARGVDRARLEARGLGGREPVVPHGDEQTRWRNRRVEFVLMR